MADLPRDVIRRRAVERFSPSRMTDEYEAVYARLLAETRRRRRKRLATGDALIAATAAAHGLPLITRDRD